MKQQLLALATLVSILVLPVSKTGDFLLSPIPIKREVVLAEQSLDLTIREPNPYANEVFSDNILLALYYLGNDVVLPVDWQEIRQPFEASFTLQPDEVFAFHENVLPEFNPPAGGPAVTMNSRFFIEEGYRAVGGLGGNGVCHLASLINWTASEAGLEVMAKINHNFAPVPGVPKEYGTSIRSQNQSQNLYLKNNFDYPVEFVFRIENQLVELAVLQ